MTQYVKNFDPVAKRCYALQNKMLQQEAKKLMLGQELQQVHDEMATESQVEELRGMMDEAQRTADRTHTQVTQLRGDVRTVIADVAALREVVDNAVQSMVVHQPTERPAEGAEKRRQQQRPAASASAPSCSAGVVASLVWTTGSALAASAGRGGRVEPGSALAH